MRTRAPAAWQTNEINAVLTARAETCGDPRIFGMQSPNTAAPHLDPDDWQAFRVASRRALDDMIDFLQTIRERPVWQQAPAEVVREFRQPLPTAPQDLDEVLADFSALIRPYATGNLHPLF